MSLLLSVVCGLVAVAVATHWVISYEGSRTVYYVYRPDREPGNDTGWLALETARGQMQLRSVLPVDERSLDAKHRGIGLTMAGPSHRSRERWQTKWFRADHPLGYTFTPSHSIEKLTGGKRLSNGYGFHLSYRTRGDYHGHPWRLFDLVVPHWFLVVLATTFAWLASRPLRAARRARRRGRRGRCPSCGYDLRGSPGGGPCPECGTAAPRGAAAVGGS